MTDLSPEPQIPDATPAPIPEPTPKPTPRLLVERIRVHDNAPETKAYWWWCQGCKALHCFDERWSFDGNLERPTFDPSYLSRMNSKNPETGEYDVPFGAICHSFVHNGQIEFLADSTHELAGLTLPLLPVPAEYFQEAPAPAQIEGEGTYSSTSS